MTCRPLTKEEADELREKYWPKVIDALNREPGESLLEWETRAKSVRESLRAAQETEPVPAKHCQNGGDVCLAGNRDGICCPDDSCDIDDGLRKNPTANRGVKP